MNILKYIWNALKAALDFFSSPAAQKAIKLAAELSKDAIPIITELAEKYSPGNSKIEDILDAYKKYGIPILSIYGDSKEGRANALLNLATEILRRRLAGKYALISTDVLNTAVQIAVTALKAK